MKYLRSSLAFLLFTTISLEALISWLIINPEQQCCLINVFIWLVFVVPIFKKNSLPNLWRFSFFLGVFWCITFRKLDFHELSPLARCIYIWCLQVHSIITFNAYLSSPKSSPNQSFWPNYPLFDHNFEPFSNLSPKFTPLLAKDSF